MAHSRDAFSRAPRFRGYNTGKDITAWRLAYGKRLERWRSLPK